MTTEDRVCSIRPTVNQPQNGNNWCVRECSVITCSYVLSLLLILTTYSAIFTAWWVKFLCLNIPNIMRKGENIVKWIKGQRISWLGHLERMEEDRMPRNIFTQELEGTRRRGRPRKRWKEEVERDLRVLGVRRWREFVADMKKMEGHCSTGQSPQ